MAAPAGPPPTPSLAVGWAEVDLPSRSAFFVRRAGQGYVHLPRAPRLARDADGRPRAALTLVLARMPTPSDASIAPLVMSGSLALVCTFSADSSEPTALTARLRARR